MTPRTEIVSVHKHRRVARLKERWVTLRGLPAWAGGARVRRAGDGGSWVVELTEWKGH